MIPTERPNSNSSGSGCGSQKLQDAAAKAQSECQTRHEVELVNRYRNVLSKSFSEAPLSKSFTATPPTKEKSRSPLARRRQMRSLTPKGSKSLTNTSIDLSPSPIQQFSTPKDEDNRAKINYHLKRIQQQIEGERWRNRNNEMKNLSDDMKSIKEGLTNARGEKGVFNLSPKLKSTPRPPPPITPSFQQGHDKLEEYKRKMDKQQAAIRLLSDELEVKEKDRRRAKSAMEEADINSRRIKVLEGQVKREENQRVKMMREHTDVKKRLQEVERERSELLFALSDVKAEAKSILLAYEEASHSLPELKSLLEVSAKQKNEFSEQLISLNKQLEEKKTEIVSLECRLHEYTTLATAKDSEKEALSKKLEESSAKYESVQKELITSNQNLSDTKQLLKEYTDSNQNLKDKVVSTLKAYRSRCQKYEDKLRTFEEDNRQQERRLVEAQGRSKELEVENCKQKEELRDLSERMEELQSNISLYVAKCQQVSSEKNQLEESLLQSNEHSNDLSALHNELLQTREHNTRLMSDLEEEKRKVEEYEGLMKKFYDNNMLLKDENANLQLAVETESTHSHEERGKHSESLGKLKEDYQLLVRNNEDLTTQLKSSIDLTDTLKKKCEDTKRSLEEQKAQTNKESLNSKALIRKLRTLSNEKLLQKNSFFKEKETLEKKLNLYESSARDNKKQHSVLLKHIENAKMDTTIGEENFKVVIEILTKDIDNLRKLLCNEGENMSHNITIPQCPNQAEIEDLREKLQSCFTVSGTLKHGYNKLRLLNRKGRETIKSQSKDLQHLKKSNKKETTKQQEKIAELEQAVQGKEKAMVQMEAMVLSLQHRMGDEVNDLEYGLGEIQSSLGQMKEIGSEFNVLESSSYNEGKQRQREENVCVIEAQLEKLRSHLSAAKCYLKEVVLDREANNIDIVINNNNNNNNDDNHTEISHSHFDDDDNSTATTITINNNLPLDFSVPFTSTSPIPESYGHVRFGAESTASVCTINSDITIEEDPQEFNSEILLVR